MRVEVDGELPSTEPISTEFLGRVRGPKGVRVGLSLDMVGRRERSSSWTTLSMAGDGEDAGQDTGGSASINLILSQLPRRRPSLLSCLQLSVYRLYDISFRARRARMGNDVVQVFRMEEL